MPKGKKLIRRKFFRLTSHFRCHWFEDKFKLRWAKTEMKKDVCCLTLYPITLSHPSGCIFAYINAFIERWGWLGGAGKKRIALKISKSL
jgi:hypothetical protein